jgi:hypothetical protein
MTSQLRQTMKPTQTSAQPSWQGSLATRTASYHGCQSTIRGQEINLRLCRHRGFEVIAPSVNFVGCGRTGNVATSLLHHQVVFSRYSAAYQYWSQPKCVTSSGQSHQEGQILQQCRFMFLHAQRPRSHMLPVMCTF